MEQADAHRSEIERLGAALARAEAASEAAARDAAAAVEKAKALAAALARAQDCLLYTSPSPRD